VSDVQDTPKPWSQCSTGELLDTAQTWLYEHQSGAAAVAVAAAQAKALQGLSRTLADKRFV